MGSITRGNVKMALASVRSTKWRSLLTMLGIIIGIVSVVMVVGIGEGVKQEVAGELSQFGKDLITVRPGNVKDNHGRVISNTDLLFGVNSISGLTQNDLQTVQQSQDVRLAAPLSVIPGTLAGTNNRTLGDGLVIATNADLPGAINQKVDFGAFFSSDDNNNNVAVIGSSAATSLFDESVPLGRTFTFRGQQFIVRGIFNEFKSTPLSPVANFNNAIFIPYGTAQRLTNNSSQIYSIFTKPDKPENAAVAIHAISANLLRAHGNEHDFSVLNQQQSLDASSNVLGLITTMIAAIAGISLLVGGVGIMNIMLASVTERMHEIGVRKAIGATNRQILNQFVLEAAVLSIVGGVLGVIISIFGVLGMRTYTDLKPVISWQAVVVATLASLIIGIVFGAAPAIKAASKDPIEALRHE